MISATRASIAILGCYEEVPARIDSRICVRNHARVSRDADATDHNEIAPSFLQSFDNSRSESGCETNQLNDSQ